MIAAARFENPGLVVVAWGLSCSVACGIVLDQGPNPHLLHWQEASFLLSHQGSLWRYILFLILLFLVKHTVFGMRVQTEGFTNLWKQMISFDISS